jgi:acyl-CoA thioesterase
MAPTSLHVQFLRAGDAALPVEYDVDRVFDGRTSKSRRVLARQDDRLLVTATVGFACSTTGPEHGKRDPSPGDPNDLPRTGPAGPAPSLPLDEIDIRIDDRATNGGFVRRLWWRATVSLPPDPFVHSCVAVFVSDVYLLDAALRVHGRSMGDRRYRSGTTDASMWFHRPIRADQWNLLESTSPAAARGRAVVTASLIGVDGAIAATLVHEGLVSER